MEVAPEATALLLARGHQPLARAKDVERQPGRVHRRAGAPGQVVEQAQVGGREALVAGPLPKQQSPDDLGAVDERQHDRLRDGSPVGRRRARRHPGGPDFKRDVRKSQGLGDAVHDHRRDPLGFDGRLEPMAKARERPVRVVAVAVHQPAHGPLEDVADRQGEDGHDPSREQRRGEPAVLREDGAQDRHAMA